MIYYSFILTFFLILFLRSVSLLAHFVLDIYLAIKYFENNSVMNENLSGLKAKSLPNRFLYDIFSYNCKVLNVGTKSIYTGSTFLLDNIT